MTPYQLAPVYRDAPSSWSVGKQQEKKPFRNNHNFCNIFNCVETVINMGLYMWVLTSPYYPEIK